MKGLVLEIRDGLAAVLREDGQVVTTDLPCQVGETIELPAEVIPFETGAKPKPNRRRWIGGLAAAAVALAVIGGGYSYNTAFASSFLSVDAQGASVELSLNRRGQVIDVRAVDEDSVILAQELSATLDRLPVEEALEQTMDTLGRRGYLEDSDEPVVIGVTADNEKRGAALDAAVDRFAKEPGQREVVALEVTPDQREEAARKQQSGGAFVYDKQKPALAPKESGDPTPVQPETESETAPAVQPQAESQSPAPAAPAQPARSSQGQTARPAENRNDPQPEEAPQTPGVTPAPVQPQESPGQPQEAVQPQIPDNEQPPAPQDAGDGEEGPAEQTPPAEDQRPSAQEPQETSPETEPEPQAPRPADQPGGNEQAEPAVSQPEQPPAAQPEAPSNGGAPAAPPQSEKDVSAPAPQERGPEGPQGQPSEP